MKIKRRHVHAGNFLIDSAALPCPRCRSENISVESHMFTGPMATCVECGSRSTLHRWNDGYIDLALKNECGTYRHVGEHYQRPESDVIEFI